jgi:hypothetical protein
MEEKISIAKKYMEGQGDRWISPTNIGAIINGGNSSVGSPVLREMLERGEVERNEGGHYRLKLSEKPGESLLCAGTRIRTRLNQPRRLTPLYPGRTGVVVSPSSIAPEHYVYVDLDATTRAKARRELYHVNDLERA